MACSLQLTLLFIILTALCTNAFISSKKPVSSTALFAKHAEHKTIRKIMHKRPKKHRLSDINRNNVNLNKCITKVENAPPEYVLIKAEDYMKERDAALKFWENGDSTAEWIDITPEDMVVLLPQNIEPLPVGGVQKRPPLVRSGTC